MVELAFLGVNDIGERIYDWLRNRDDVEVLGIFTEREQLDVIRKLEPELILSAGYRHIVPADIIEIPELGAVNIHKSYLPYNRGMNPNVWSIVEDNPAGVSIHYMTPKVDQGSIIDRQKVPVRPDDNGRDLYERLEDAQFEQFKRVWGSIRDGKTETTEQNPDEGTYHYKDEFIDMWEIDLQENVQAADLLDTLRALTFPPYDNAYFEKDGQKYHVEVSITPEDMDTENEADEKNVPTYTDE